MPRLHPLLTSVLAWAVGAATAVGVGLLALSLIRSGLTEDAFQPLAPDSVAQAGPDPSATVGGPASTPPATAGPTNAGAGASAERRVTSAGGTVVARCQGDLAYLVYWTPEPGFRPDNVSRGPAPLARVTFERSGEEITVTVGCVGGVPQPTVRRDWSDDTGHE